MGTGLAKDHSSKQNIPAIIEDLLKNAPLYNFTAAVKIICAWLTSQDLPTTWPQLKFAAHLSLAFNTSEIQDISRSKDNHFVIYLNFLTIYGTSSPLPNYYTEELFNNLNQGSPVIREFLDLFQHRLYEKYYNSSQSGQLIANSIEPDDYTHQIYSLAGLGNQSLIPPTIPQKKLLRYAGIFSCKLRTFTDLLKLLMHYTGITVEVDPCFLIQRSITSTQQLLLGQKNCQLGETSYLGQSYLSIKNTINLRFLDLTSEQFNNLLPKQNLANEIKELIQLYILQSINVHVELQLRHATTQRTVLGTQADSRLGMGSWLGQSNPHPTLNLAYQLM